MQLNKKKNVNNLHKFIARQKIVLKAKSRKRERVPVIAKFYFVLKTPNWIILFKHKVKYDIEAFYAEFIRRRKT